MYTPQGSDEPSSRRAPWRCASAYFYTLDLDGPGLAWEYLRRHPDYRAEWACGRRALAATRWGLRCRREP